MYLQCGLALGWCFTEDTAPLRIHWIAIPGVLPGTQRGWLYRAAILNFRWLVGWFVRSPAADPLPLLSPLQAVGCFKAIVRHILRVKNLTALSGIPASILCDSGCCMDWFVPHRIAPAASTASAKWFKFKPMPAQSDPGAVKLASNYPTSSIDAVPKFSTKYTAGQRTFPSKETPDPACLSISPCPCSAFIFTDR